jgi:hypothetical protein
MPLVVGEFLVVVVVVVVVAAVAPAMPRRRRLRRLDSGFSPRKTVFRPSPFHVGRFVNNAIPGQVFAGPLLFYPVSNVTPYSLIYYGRHVILETADVV